MIQQCTDPGSRQFKDYGGRGISVCAAWLSFECFYADVGDPPFKGASLDRMVNDGNYEPGNVAWADRSQQSRNKRNNTLFEFKGVSKVLPDWAKELGISKATLASRIYLYKGSVDAAFSTPVNGRKGKRVPKIIEELFPS